MYISELLKLTKRKEGERDLRLYKRCNFMLLYRQFDETVLGKYDSPAVRKKWKSLLLDIDYVNSRIWKIASIRRRVNEWDEYTTKYIHKIVFEVLIKMKDIYDQILWLITTETAIWHNTLINVLSQYKLSKDEVYEIMPYASIESFKILLRQIFRPVINMLTGLENELLNNKVDEEKLRQLEESMLVSVLPWLENVFRSVIETQGESIW